VLSPEVAFAVALALLVAAVILWNFGSPAADEPARPLDGRPEWWRCPYCPRTLTGDRDEDDATHAECLRRHYETGGQLP
jgi:hypothetical protein